MAKAGKAGPPNGLLIASSYSLKGRLVSVHGKTVPSSSKYLERADIAPGLTKPELPFKKRKIFNAHDTAKTEPYSKLRIVSSWAAGINRTGTSRWRHHIFQTYAMVMENIHECPVYFHYQLTPEPEVGVAWPVSIGRAARLLVYLR
jgi:hypothetical protein